MKSDISFLLSKGKQGHLYERTIPELVQMVIEYLDKETSGILPFFSKARSGHKEFLCALILKENEAYFYLKNTNKYYEFERSNNECN